jgi:hypothetical protein
MSEAALEPAQDRQRLLRLARAISWIGHPLVFISVAVGVIVALRLANRAGLTVLLTLLVCIVLPMALLLFRGVRSGRWSDADVSVRKERTRFYPRAIPISAIGVIALWFIRAPAFALHGAIATLALLVISALINFRIKLSLHALFAVYSSVILFSVNIVAGSVAIALALLVFWSRLYLGRHNVLEMMTGTLLGLAGGAGVVWWP